MSTINYINGKIIDPRDGSLSIQNIMVKDGLILGLGYLPDENDADVEVVNLKQKLLIPNVIDSSVTLMSPGFEDRETLSALSNAAKNSGVTHVVGFPALSHDSPENILHLQIMAKKAPDTQFHLVGDITKKKNGEELAEISLMKDEGIVAVADVNSPDNLALFKNALIYTKDLNIPLVIRPRESALSDGGVINSGAMATQLGLKAQPMVSESLRVARDIQMLRYYGGHIHFFPITTKESLRLIAQAKSEGLSVTCGTAPHYLYFTEDDLVNYDTFKKVCPPLRTQEDQRALIQGIKDGTVDCIGSDHKPMSYDEKRCDFQSATFGISSIDYFLPLVINKLHHEENISWGVIQQVINSNPRRIFNLPNTKFSIGDRAQFTVIDIDTVQTIVKENICSDGKNCPYIGLEIKSKITHHIL